MAAADLLDRGETPSRAEITTCSPAISAAAPGTSRSSTRSRRRPEERHEPRRLAARRLRAPPGARGVPRDSGTGAAPARARGSPAGSALEPGERLAVVLDNRLETALLYWAAQWAGAVFVPLSWRVSEDELDYCLADCGARVVFRSGDALPDGAGASRVRSTATSDEPSLMLYTSGTTGRPKGVPRSHRADRAGGLVAGAAARLRLGRPHARRDAALPHDGHPLAARDAPRRRLLRAAAALGRRRRRCG